MKQLFLLLFASVLTGFLNAQQITGSVKDENGKGLASATAVLKKAKDSSSIKFAVTNEEGKYTFNDIEAGSYFVNISFVGYEAQNSNQFEVNGTAIITVKEFQLNKPSGNLKEVVVTTRKPAIEVRADKTILNVEGS